MEAKQTALQILSKISGTPEQEIGPQMHLVADLGIDSPKALELLVELEEQLSLEISDEDAARMNTVGDIFEFLGVTA